jgi:hypothetical protein
MIERDWFLAPAGELFIHHVEHFEERHVLVQGGRGVMPEFAGRVAILLPPDFEGDFHAETFFFGLRRRVVGRPLK